MAAWKHTSYWDSQTYQSYRDYVRLNAPRWRGNWGLDCGDLSTVLLLYFASENGLPVTLKNSEHIRFISKGGRPTPYEGAGRKWRDTWNSTLEYVNVIKDRLGVEDLWRQNTVRNPQGPQAGDVMIAFGRGEHHAALIYAVYGSRIPHPRAKDKSVPDFPGDEEAVAQRYQTQYFRDRKADQFVHVDYLNYRSKRKDRAELIYFANAAEMQREGYQFRLWAPGVLDNWQDWDGTGDPPR